MIADFIADMLGFIEEVIHKVAAVLFDAHLWKVRRRTRYQTTVLECLHCPALHSVPYDVAPRQPWWGRRYTWRK